MIQRVAEKGLLYHFGQVTKPVIRIVTKIIDSKKIVNSKELPEKLQALTTIERENNILSVYEDFLFEIGDNFSGKANGHFSAGAIYYIAMLLTRILRTSVIGPKYLQ